MRRFFVFAFLLLLFCATVNAQQDVRLTTYDGALVRSTNPLPVDASVTIGSITVSVFPVYADESGNPATCTVDADSRAWVNLASDTIGLVDAILAMSSTSTADISALQAAVASVTSEIENSGVNASETVLIAKLDELLSASASETVVISAISAVETEVASGNVAINASVGAVEIAVAAVETAVAPPAGFSETNTTLVANTTTDVISIANRRNISLRAYTDNTEITWVKFDSETASAAVETGFPLHPGALVSLDLPEEFDVSVISSGAESIYIAQQGE